MRILKWLIVVLAVLLFAFWAWSYFTMRDTEPHAYAPVTDEQKSEAQAYLKASLRPMPEGWQWQDFEPEEGVHLRTGQVDVAGANDTVLIIPGYTAMVELYSDAAHAFAEAGYNVAAIDYRGQGLSHRDLPNPEKGHIESWDKLTSDVSAYIAKLKEEGASRVFVYANSMGGHLALRMAGIDRPDVEGYFLLVPMVQIETGAFPYPVARGLTTFYSYTGLSDAFVIGRGPFVPGAIPLGTASECMDNPATAQRRDALFILDEEYRVTGNTNEWVWRTMNSTDRITSPDFLATIDKPFYMVTAGIDKWVSTPKATETCEAMNACTLAHYTKSRHCIADETPQVAAEIYARALAFFSSL